MLSIHIILGSAGSLSVAMVALLMFILQVLFFVKRPRCTWYVWASAMSFSALLYAVSIFLEYNTSAGPLNRFSGILEWTALVCLIHSLYGFTFSYLGLHAKPYHLIAGIWHALILSFMWFTPYVVADRFVTRDLMGLTHPYIEPALGPLGPVFILYAVTASVTAMGIWIKSKAPDPNYRNTYLAGMSFWLLLGIHDALVSLSVSKLPYMLEYGFLGFAMAVLWVVFNSYLEMAAEEKYRVITEFANDCILVLQEGKVVFANTACAGLIDRPLTGSTPVDFLDSVVPEDRKALLEHYALLMEGGHAPSPHPVRMERKDGDQRFADITASAIRYRNRPAILAVVRDVTERVQAEKEKILLETQLQQAKKMEAIATLAGGIAHQFNNALFPIIAGLDLLEMGLTDPARAENSIKRMRRCTERMGRLTDQLLAYAEGGKYHPQSISLSAMVTDTLPLIRHTLSSDIEVVTDLPEDISPVRGDVTQMQMVLSAILSNASEAITGKGRIRISARNTEMDTDTPDRDADLKSGSYVSLILEDNGKGMDEETRNRIFEPFFSTKFEGRGLGMAAVYGIIKNHHGQIRVHSELNKGTTVQILLPAVTSLS